MTQTTSTPVEVQMAIGRVLRMMQRPTEPGDIEMYEKCRAIVMDYAEASQMDLGYSPNYARDRLLGAQGDS